VSATVGSAERADAGAASRPTQPAADPAVTDALVRRLHTGALVAALWLYATSPWLAMLRRVPKDASLVDYAHLLVGAAASLLAVAFLAAGLRAGRGRSYFPWAAGGAVAVVRDLGGLFRGRLPANEGPGLNSALQGLVLLAMLATAATGVGWFVAQGGDAALAWRAAHATLAHAFGGLVVLHAITALLHVLDFARG
jgi:cytochrome b561